jgi:choline dehydrogenase-like flavoprotein
MCGRPSVGSERVVVMAYFEQAPNPDSRVRLGSRLDPLGQRSIEVDWRPTPLDLDSYRVSSAVFGQQLARHCRARFEPAAWLTDRSVLPAFHSTAHHIGTTRMADNAREGVVDRHCRVHGIQNLHVAGSSVFPTGGWAFPTLTIVALALRLAERLKPALEISGL